MRCRLCGGSVEWQGPLTDLKGTKCLSCGETNCQEVEPEPPASACNGLLGRIAALESALESMVYQFAYRGDDPVTLDTGGLSALEEAFDVLGWPDPKPVPELECASQGCHKTATCGTPTKDGYKRLCHLHFDIAQIDAV